MGLDTSLVVRQNLEITFSRAMELQDAWTDQGFGHDEFVVTSGLRSYETQTRLIGEGKSNAKHSKHLAGLAVDIADNDGRIGRWLYDNQKILENIGLWMEHPNFTKGWVHVQSSPPKSLKRVFIP